MLVTAWLDHLCLCAVSPVDQEHATSLVAKNDKGKVTLLRFKPAVNPVDLLDDLTQLYRRGQTEPLLFFSKSSYDFARTMIKGNADFEKREQAAFEKAHATYFAGNSFMNIPPEGEEPHLALLFGADNPLEPGYCPWHEAPCPPGFADLALQVYEPLLDHLEEIG